MGNYDEAPREQQVPEKVKFGELKTALAQLPVLITAIREVALLKITIAVTGEAVPPLGFADVVTREDNGSANDFSTRYRWSMSVLELLTIYQRASAAITASVTAQDVSTVLQRSQPDLNVLTMNLPDLRGLLQLVQQLNTAVVPPDEVLFKEIAELVRIDEKRQVEKKKADVVKSEEAAAAPASSTSRLLDPLNSAELCAIRYKRWLRAQEASQVQSPEGAPPGVFKPEEK